MKINGMIIAVDYCDQLLFNNRAIACFVVTKKDHTVVQTSICSKPEYVNRWFEAKKTDFDVKKHHFLISSTSIIGEIVETVEQPASASAAGMAN